LGKSSLFQKGFPFFYSITRHQMSKTVQLPATFKGRGYKLPIFNLESAMA